MKHFANRNFRIGAGVLTILLLWQVAERTSQKPDRAAQPQCVLVGGGNIWTNAVLYENSACSKRFAKIMGGNDDRQGQRMVKIRFNTGEQEWKTREAVAEQAYVKSNDPALTARQWQKFSD